MKKTLLSMLAVLVGLSGLAQTKTAVSPNLKHRFQFDAKGNFRVMQITDIQGMYPLEKPVKQLIRQGIRKYRPALIILTGDNTNGYSKHGNFEKAIAEFIDIFRAEKVPFAVTFGNHDSQRKGKQFYTRQEQYDIYKKTGGKYFVDFDIPELTGVGNGTIPLYSEKTGKPVFNLIVMDSGDYAKGGGYDGCYTDQIRWYEENAGDLPCLWFQHIIIGEIHRTNVFRLIPSKPAKYRIVETQDAAKGEPDAFFSKPLNKYIRKLPARTIWSKPLNRYVIPEPGMVWSEKQKCYLSRPNGAIWDSHIDSFVKLAPGMGVKELKERITPVPAVCINGSGMGLGVGDLREQPCSPLWKIYTDAAHTYEGRTLYQSWLKKGNLKGAYFGHDHMNAFDITDRNGIRLGYCKGATLCSYNDGNPGIRVFDISENGSYKTEICTVKQLGVRAIYRYGVMSETLKFKDALKPGLYCLSFDMEGNFAMIVWANGAGASGGHIQYGQSDTPRKIVYYFKVLDFRKMQLRASADVPKGNKIPVQFAAKNFKLAALKEIPADMFPDFKTALKATPDDANFIYCFSGSNYKTASVTRKTVDGEPVMEIEGKAEKQGNSIAQTTSFPAVKSGKLAVKFTAKSGGGSKQMMVLVRDNFWKKGGDRKNFTLSNDWKEYSFEIDCAQKFRDGIVLATVDCRFGQGIYLFKDFSVSYKK